MPGLFALTNGQELVQYDVDDFKVARNNLDGTFGPLIDVPSCDLVTATITNKNATMHGDAHVTVASSAPESAQAQFRFGSVSAPVFNIITGSTEQTSGSTPARKTEMSIGAGQDFPYFAVVARCPDGLGKGGATMIFLPCCKVMQTIEVHVEYNQFIMPQITGMAIGDPVLLIAGRPLLMTFKFYETAVNIAIPMI